MTRIKVKQITAYLNNVMIENRLISKEAIHDNMRRLYFMCVIGSLASLAHIVPFLFFTSAEGSGHQVWSTSIVLTHMAMLVVFILLGLASRYFRQEIRPCVWAYVTQYIAMAFVLSAGVAIASIDQLVTSNITPFLIACIVISLVFTIRPSLAVIYYLVTYVVYYFLIGLLQTDMAVLLSNRVNGITAVTIGIFLSIVLWQANVKNYRQSLFINQQQRELEETNKKLVYLAAYDSMTGLINRGEFERKVEHELLRMQQYGYDSCIVIADIDDFKTINDKYGHPAGDVLLENYARLMEAQLRNIDYLARWGGEEFIILLPNTNLEEGLRVAERLRKVTEEKAFLLAETPVNITTSFGVAKLPHDSKAPFQQAYERADKALYRAKEKGKNWVVADL